MGNSATHDFERLENEDFRERSEKQYKKSVAY